MDDFKKEVLCRWLNCLGLGPEIDAIQQLQDCEFLVYLTGLIRGGEHFGIPKPNTLESRIVRLKAFIEKQYGVIADEIIDFKDFNEYNISKVVLLILCAAIEEGKKEAFIDPVLKLDPKWQVPVTDMMQKIIMRNKSSLNQVLCEVIGIPVTASSGLLCKRAYRLPMPECVVKSPIQQLMESTEISQQLELKDKAKLVKQLTSALNQEKETCADLQRDLEEKCDALKMQEKTLQELRKKLHSAEEQSAVYKSYLELCDAKDEEIERLHNKIKQLSAVASNVPSLEKEIMDLIHQRNELELKIETLEQISVEHKANNKRLAELESEMAHLVDESDTKDAAITNLAAALQEANEQILKSKDLYTDQIDMLKENLEKCAGSPGFKPMEVEGAENMQEAFTDKILSEMKAKYSELEKQLREADEKLKIAKFAVEESKILEEENRALSDSWRAKFNDLESIMEETQKRFASELQQKDNNFECLKLEKLKMKNSFGAKIAGLETQLAEETDRFSCEMREKLIELEKLKSEKLLIEESLNEKLKIVEGRLESYLLDKKEKDLELEKITDEKREMQTKFTEQLTESEERFTLELNEKDLELERLKSEIHEMEKSLNEKLAYHETQLNEKEQRFLSVKRDMEYKLECVKMEKLQVEKSLNERLMNLENLLSESEKSFLLELKQKDTELEKVTREKLDVETAFTETSATFESEVSALQNQFLADINQKDIEIERMKTENVAADKLFGDKVSGLEMRLLETEERVLLEQREKDEMLERMNCEKLDLENCFKEKLSCLETQITKAEDMVLLAKQEHDLELEKVTREKLEIEKAFTEKSATFGSENSVLQNQFLADLNQKDMDIERMKVEIEKAEKLSGEKVSGLEIRLQEAEERFLLEQKEKDEILKRIQCEKLDLENCFKENLSCLEAQITEEMSLREKQEMELEKVKADKLQLEESFNEKLRNLENVLVDKEQRFLLELQEKDAELEKVTREKQDIETAFTEKSATFECQVSALQNQFFAELNQKDIEIERMKVEIVTAEKLFGEKVSGLEMRLEEAEERFLLEQKEKDEMSERMNCEKLDLENCFKEKLSCLEVQIAEAEDMFLRAKQEHELEFEKIIAGKLQLEDSLNEKLEKLENDLLEKEEIFLLELQKKDEELGRILDEKRDVEKCFTAQVDNLTKQLAEREESSNDKLKTLEKLLEESEQELLTAKKGQDNELKQALEIAESEIIKLQEKYRNRELHFDSMIVERKAMSSKCEYLDGKVAELKRSENVMRQKYEHAKSVIKAVTDERDMLEGVIKQHEAEVEKIKEYCAEKADKLNAATSLLKSAQEKSQNLSEEVEGLKREMARLIEKLEEKEVRLTWFNVKVQDLEEQYNIMRDRHDNHEKPTCTMVPRRISLPWTKPDSPRLLSPTKSVSEINLDMPPPQPRLLHSTFASCDNLARDARSKPTIPSGMGGYFACEEEEGEFLSHNYLDDLKRGKCAVKEDVIGRFSELHRRNTLCLPHLKSSYPVESQTKPPSLYSESALKSLNEPMLDQKVLSEIHSGTVNNGASSSTWNQSASEYDAGVAQRKLKVSQATYQKPGPPTPGKNGKPVKQVKTPASLKRFLASKRSDENNPSVQKTRKNLAFSIGFSPKGKDDSKRPKK